MKETRLAESVIKYFEELRNWDIYQEVRIGGIGSPIIDIIAREKYHPIYWGIECKTSLTMSVIAQAYRNHSTTMTSIAVPTLKTRPLSGRNHGREMAYEICKYYGIGVFEVNKTYGKVYKEIGPKYRRWNGKYDGKHNLERYLNENQKHYAQAGGKSGYWTPYNDMMSSVKRFIKDNPGCLLNDIMKGINSQGYEVLRNTLGINLRKYEYDWCLIKKDGRYNRYYVIAKEKRKTK